MKIYISGPMTGYENFNYPAFQSAADSLRLAGHEVVSPHEVSHPENGVVGSLPWTDYLRRDLAEMLPCEAIALLHGWPKSKGAKLELATALALEMRVFYIIDGALHAAADQA